jgi:uncharacterized Zn finger protein (UPF0148 family)
MGKEAEELAYCPNCNKPAFRKGKVIVCEFCDDQLGPLDARLKTIEEKLGIGATPKPETNESDDEPKTNESDDEPESDDEDDW